MLNVVFPVLVVLTKDKTSMSLRMLNARLYIKNPLKFYSNKPELVPFTKELLSLVKSVNSSYKNYLEEKINLIKMPQLKLYFN